MQTPDVKHCPICSLDLPITDFGFCRARQDGHNLYCKACIRQKVTESRRALKEYKAAQKKRLDQIKVQMFEESVVEISSSRRIRLSPVERVRNAIREGKHTQAEIAEETKLGKDEIGDAIANLLLWNKEIRTQVIDNTRIYFFRDEAPVLVDRKPNVKSYYSVLLGFGERKRMVG